MPVQGCTLTFTVRADSAVWTSRDCASGNVGNETNQNYLQFLVSFEKQTVYPCLCSTPTNVSSARTSRQSVSSVLIRVNTRTQTQLSKHKQFSTYYYYYYYYHHHYRYHHEGKLRKQEWKCTEKTTTKIEPQLWSNLSKLQRENISKLY